MYVPEKSYTDLKFCLFINEGICSECGKEYVSEGLSLL
ncbi:hypothetical protein EMUR_01165 [Ehrlichia muris AS145]|uniref:Uncharacterized protein n=1 Tax=Ehrlichia muris AS145 TaxID=1423892 RepID=V9R7B6_9RICK|nr:hypothetical protein EMUR_01165 [Ehrlichia muris AS145]